MTDKVLTNDVTGDRLVTRQQNKAYQDNYDNIFGEKVVNKTTRPEINVVKKNGLFYFEGETNGYDFLSALELYPKIDYVWKVIND